MESSLSNNIVAGVDIPDPMAVRRYRAERASKETYDTFTMELRAADGNGGWRFEPGQFNMLYVFGVGEVPISISGRPDKPDTLVHTTRAVGPVTRAMSKIRAGDSIGVRGPFGTSWPVEAASGLDVVIVAGGIGLAPLRPAVYYLLENRKKFRRIALLYGARTPEDLLYTKELEKWRLNPEIELLVTVDRATGSWQGNVGVVTNMIPKATFDPLNSIAMVCGPEIMMRFTSLGLLKRNMPAEKIYISMERNMKCGVGLCGHCQMREYFICKDGPVFNYAKIREMLTKRET